MPPAFTPRPPPKYYSGDVHWIDHSRHSGPNSQNTLKDPHYAVILTSNNLLMNPAYPLVNYVPMTSFKKDQHWDEKREALIYPTNVLLKVAEYTQQERAIDKDTIVDCGQVHTCDIGIFNDFRFRLNKNDLLKIRAKLTTILGYGV